MMLSHHVAQLQAVPALVSYGHHAVHVHAQSRMLGLARTVLGFINFCSGHLWCAGADRCLGALVDFPFSGAKVLVSATRTAEQKSELS